MSKRRAEKSRNGTLKSVEPTFPVQCMRLEIPEAEWYGNWERTGKKQRFLRTNIRSAFMVPASGVYPHLTIDVDFLRRDYRKGIVELTVSRLHYSKSPKARRYIFKEEARSGMFMCEDLEDVSSIVREGNVWLSKAGFPIVLTPHPDYKEEEIAEAAAALTVAEEELKGTGREEAEVKPKKKKKKKAKKMAVSELLEEEQLEEKVKLLDLSGRLGVQNLWELPGDRMNKLLGYLSTVIKHFSENQWERVTKNKDRELKELMAELGRWRALLKMGRSINNLAKVEGVREKVLKERAPLMSGYHVADLLPPSLKGDALSPKEESKYIIVGLAFGCRMCVSLMLRLQAGAIYEKLSAYIRFFSELASEKQSMYFQQFCILLFKRLKVVWLDSEGESPQKLLRMQISNPRKADENLVHMEKEHDESLAQMAESFDHVETAVKSFFLLSGDAKQRLEDWAHSQPAPEYGDDSTLTKEESLAMANAVNAEIEAYKKPMEMELMRESTGKLK
ncbi:MAG: hypothetical protein MI784_10040 [Cytophagales bacterium]|nr:hypothetical protein [Cytophagales bacterium]